MVCKSIIRIVGYLMLLSLAACADMSMYNQVPAPVGQQGQGADYYPPVVTSDAQTYPLESDGENNELTKTLIKPEVPVMRSGNAAVLALLDTAKQQKQEGHLGVAASKLERAVRIAPRDAIIWHELAIVRYQQGQFKLAEGLAKKSTLYSTNNRRLIRDNWLLIAQSREQLGNSELAKKARLQAEKFR